MSFQPEYTEMETLIAIVRERFGLKRDDVLISALKGGNNRVFKVCGGDRTFIVKHYYAGRRDRLATEYGFLEYAWHIGNRQIPKPLFSMPEHQIACYEYIPGQKLKPSDIGEDHISQVLLFVKNLNQMENRRSETASLLPDASEACFSFEAHQAAVGQRVARLDGITPEDGVNRRGRQFVEQRLKPVWERLSSENAGAGFPRGQLARQHQIISPSDFGFHNAIQKMDGRLVFIDFEYAGWDDPAKLICDFFCQVAVPVPLFFLDTFNEHICRIIDTGPDFYRKVERLMPFYRLKWCCIMMNDFLAAGERRKKFAAFHADMRAAQLEKVERYADKFL